MLNWLKYSMQVVYNIDNIECVILTVFNLFGIDSLTELRAKGYEIFQHVGKDEYIVIRVWCRFFTDY